MSDDEFDEKPQSPNAGDPHTDARERVSERDHVEDASVFPLEDRDSNEHPNPDGRAFRSAIESEEERAKER